MKGLYCTGGVNLATNDGLTRFDGVEVSVKHFFFFFFAICMLRDRM